MLENPSLIEKYHRHKVHTTIFGTSNSFTANQLTVGFPETVSFSVSYSPLAVFMWTMSDRGIPRSYRMMQGFGVNTYSLINAEGTVTLVKFHFTPKLGVHSLGM